MRSTNRAIIILWAFCYFCGATTTIVYRPNDYLNGVNPNSYWSFGYTIPNDRLNFRLYPHYVENSYGTSESTDLQSISMPGYNVRCSCAGAESGLIGINMNQNKTIRYKNELRLQPRQLTFHPGPHNQRPAIRFIAPSSGVYDIEGIFFAPGFLNSGPDATTDAHLSINDVELLSLWVTRTPGMLRLGQFYLQAHDYVQFEVGWGNNNNYFYDTTAANIRIVYYGSNDNSCRCHFPWTNKN